jgi:DNA-binding response OmpR family regulator
MVRLPVRGTSVGRHQVRILLVEDNSELTGLLASGLKRAGFDADAVGNAGDAAHALMAMSYSAVVLDLGLPDEDGLTLLRGIRDRGNATPVLVLTARDGVRDRVEGLRAGADDYVAKPFAMEELVARLQALLRRPGNLLGRRLSFGNVCLHTENRQVTVAGTACALPARETAVLEILLRRGGSVVSKRLVEDQLFGLSSDFGSNAIEVYIHRLRKFLADNSATARIHTVRGVGYLLAGEKTG